jgi:hypothetical protein
MTRQLLEDPLGVERLRPVLSRHAPAVPPRSGARTVHMYWYTLAVP